MKIEKVLQQFSSIKLEEMSQVRLMNRTDRKYWFNAEQLPEILQAVQEDYFALEIDGDFALPYATTYYDTLDNNMYSEHHRGKLNRFKIRRRNYSMTSTSFLEIKYKSNKGRTMKERIPTDYQRPEFNKIEGQFIDNNSPYSTGDLSPVLVNGFNRLTLVNKNMRERCTIDQNIKFKGRDNKFMLDNLVIVEVKTEGHTAISPIINALKERRIKASGFSKYCIGRSIADNHLKINTFKSKHRQIEKQIETSINSLITKYKQA